MVWAFFFLKFGSVDFSPYLCVIKIRNTMTTQTKDNLTFTLLSYNKYETGFSKKYKVEYKGNEDIVFFHCNSWGVGFEPTNAHWSNGFNGNWPDGDFDELSKILWDDAYYVSYEKDINE